MRVAWTDHRNCYRDASIGQDTPFQTKPQLAQRMLRRLLDNPSGWDTRRSTTVRRSPAYRVRHADRPMRANTPAPAALKRGWQRRLSCGAPLDEQRRAGLLHRAHHPPSATDRTRSGRRKPTACRGNLPVRQERDRARPLSGPALRSQLPPYQPDHARRPF
ncbi:hypothetical protein SACE_4947 [Saccharopolyspora erythraea NRRL 2338]|uniref:Uncharacterized protein n=1 Tax=Saccharopolyspora erythraea (strain ATCC 11635 / DSM 40517 / JCM 4748 / NBRC 13426 / NCIMB 8594 / NRRL 2338) TaxID=405948 RepID=A4FJI8_SACEN|nr:hypothetical protein SACE_4947 [Saccharopolyspora erythraea NRRL 2338]